MDRFQNSIKAFGAPIQNDTALSNFVDNVHETAQIVKAKIRSRYLGF